MKKCPTCNKETENRRYCSRLCQYKGYSKTSRIKTCPICNTEHKNKIFCSRKCYAVVDSKRKLKYYSTNDHHTLGRKATAEQRQYIREMMIEKWKEPEHRLKVSQSLAEVRANAEFPLGHSPAAREKRINTMLERYGETNNLIGTYGTRDCDKTMIERHGMSSHEYRNLKLRSMKITSIERKVMEILNEYNIQFEYEYVFGGYSFDFYLPTFGVFIECDGDYHHGYGILHEDMDKIQKNTYNNDQIKNNIIKETDYTLVRYWGHEIKADGFKSIIRQIWEK